MMVLYQHMFEGNLVYMAQAQQSAVDRIPYGLLLARLGQESTARFRRSLRPLNLGAQQFIGHVNTVAIARSRQEQAAFAQATASG